MFRKLLAVLFLTVISFVINVNYGKCELSVGTGSSGSTGSVTLNNPLGSASTDPNVLIGKIINGALGIVGSIALVMFIYGGFVWMTAMGASDKVTKGKDIIIWASIGLIVIFSAYAMVNFVLGDIIGGIAT